ncbi:MAG: hypothetical protein NZL93_03465, partial [Chthoniobacterales bacterium]|nr:hypothetical protein [Chthoniobacterales bacterium]
CTAEGKWTPDFSNDKSPYTRNWTLIRRQGDALLYLLKTASLLEHLHPNQPLPHRLLPILRRTADSFVRLWRNYGQFGQFIDQDSAKIFVGGSTSGAIVPAALVAAWKRFHEPSYLNVAEEAATLFAREVLARGYTNGGPGDALQNPDSESAAALLESYAALHSATNDREWLNLAKQTAALLSTWVMPYNFLFPSNSEFGRLKIQTLGSVFANTQNKHAAPGICTHSGSALLYLWQCTGDRRLLNLALDIARFLPQCLSRPDRPIHAQDGRPLPSGWINERVNTSDWDENLGGVFYGSCWCEVSLLLTALEFPGILIIPDTREIVLFDHVLAEWKNNTELHIHNPTNYPARVRILSDPSLLLKEFWFLNSPSIEIQPRESLNFPVFS